MKTKKLETASRGLIFFKNAKFRLVIDRDMDYTVLQHDFQLPHPKNLKVVVVENSKGEITKVDIRESV